ERTNVLRLGALRPLCDVEVDLLVLLQAAVTVSLDRRVVDEDVSAALDGNEAEALLSVEPLHNTLRHVLSLTRIRHPHRAAAGPARAWLRSPKITNRADVPRRENTYLELRPRSP